jgi:hypothetical protein
VESFCLSGKKASHLEDMVDDEIINGKFEKRTLFKRKSIPTIIHPYTITKQKMRETPFLLY